MLDLIAPGLLVTILVAWACWLWAVWLDPRPAIRLLAALVGTSTVIVVTQVALGALGWLTPGGLLAAGLLVAVVLIVFFFAAGARSLDDVAAACNPFAIRRPTIVGVVLWSLTAVVYGWLTFVGTLVPPYGWDTLTYHLTNVFHFAQAGNLSVFPYPGYIYYYSQAGELHSLWFYLLAGGHAGAWRVVGLGLVPFVLTLGVAGRATAEALGLRVGLPWIAPAVMLSPVVVIHPLSGYVDVVFAGLLAAAVAFAALAAEEGRLRHVVMAALASGLALGVKGSFLYLGIMVLVVLAGRRVWSRLREGRPRLLVARLALIAVVFSVGCAFWYGRNAIDTGNPLYPINVRVAGVEVFHGPVGLPSPGYRQELYVPTAAHWLRYPLYETIRDKVAYTSDSGLGPQFAIGWMATLVMIPVAVATRRWTLLKLLLAIPVWWLMLVLVSPVVQIRYIIAVVPVAIVALAAMAEMSTLPGSWRRQRTEAEPRPEPDPFSLSPPLLRRMAATGTSSAEQERPRVGPKLVFDLAVVAACLFSSVGAMASAAPDLETVMGRWHDGHWSPEDYYVVHYGPAGAAFNWFGAQGGPATTVTFTNSTFVAPIFGWDNANHVVYAATPDRLDIGPAPRVRSYREWLTFLVDADVDWVVVWIPWWGESSNDLAESWIRSHPEDFELLEDFGGRCQVFRPLVDTRTLARRSSVGVAEEVAGLASAAKWVQEYATGTEVSWTDDAEGGIAFDFSFAGPGNDYADLRTVLENTDWRSFDALELDLVAAPQPTLLFVYLKNGDPREACRYRIDVGWQGPGETRVALDLAHPDWKTPDFDLGDVREIHLVIDDAEDSWAGRGTMRLEAFELARFDDISEQTTEDAGAPAQEEGLSQ